MYDQRLKTCRKIELRLYSNIIKIVGDSQHPFRNDKEVMIRIPGLAEGIWHLCMALAARVPEFHPPGQIIALDSAHVIAKDHGLDVAALYRTDGDNWVVAC